MLSCKIIPYTMLLRLKFKKKKATWRPACSPTHAARSAKCLRVAAKTRTKTRPTRHLTDSGETCRAGCYFYLFMRRRQRKHGEWSSFTSLYAKYANIFEKQTPTLLSWRIYISIHFALRPTMPCTSRTTGGFVVFFLSLFCLSLTASLQT